MISKSEGLIELTNAELDQVCGGDATSNGILAAVVVTAAAMGPTPAGIWFLGSFVSSAVADAIAVSNKSNKPKT